MAKPKTRKEIAAEMNITPDEVMRIQEKAMVKALRMLESWGVGREILDDLNA